jgi:hypothetical protein
MIFRKARTAVVTVVLCIAVFLVVNTIHFQLLSVGVVLYDSLLDAAIATAIVYVASLILHRQDDGRLSVLERLLSITIGGLLCALYAVLGPAIIDRSLSIYILEKLEQRGGGIKFDALPGVFINEYIPEHRLTDIRVTEQLQSGTIRLKDGCVYLTTRGKAIVSFSRFYRLNILPKKREIMGEYTDALTDPFRNSVKDVTYKCAPPAN